jgi:NitT/TauT family transport system substrate-binding protein
MPNLTRPAFLGATFAALAAPAIAADAPLITLRIGTSPDHDVVPILLGAQHGIFRKYGLDPIVQRMNSGSAVIPGVIGGSLEIGKSSTFGLVLAQAKGFPIMLEAVSSFYSADAPNNGFVVAKTAAITSPRDLNGKTIASPALGDLSSIVTAAWIDQNGGDSKTVKYVELPTTLAAASIVSARVDGALILDPILESAITTGGCRILGHPYDIVAKYWDASLWFCLRSYAEQNADVMTRFRAALRESIVYAQAHHDEVVTAVSKFTGMDPSAVASMPLDIGTTLAPQDVQPVIDFAARHKLISSSFRATEFIDAGALRRS